MGTASRAGGVPLFSDLRGELTSRRAIPGVVAGLVIGPVMVILTISFAALIFAGPLEAHLPRAIGIALVSAAVVSGTVALLASYPAFIAYPNDRTAPILALMAASIVAALPGAEPAVLFATVAGALMLAALLTGALLLGLGAFRLGAFIRFIPYPVFGGFLAGTGWLLVRGALRVMTGMVPSAATAGRFLEANALAHWLPGLALAVALLAATRRWRHFLVLPGVLLGSLALFYALLPAFGATPEDARAAGFLLGPFPPAAPWRPVTLTAAAGARWGIVLAQAGSLGTILFVSAVSVLLNASAMELAAGQDIDLNRELKASGAASLLSGALGGLPGFTVLSLTGLVLKMGVRSRLAGIVTAAVCAGALLAGTTPLAYFPKPVLGGLLMFLGFAFLAEWVYDTWFRLTRPDYAVIILILVVVASLGYLPGVGVGVVTCIVLFVVAYSRVRVVKHALSGAAHRSNVDRPREQRQTLRERGEAVLILKLQGYLFFGTASQVLDAVRARAAAAAGPSLRYAVLDFSPVTGVDTSSVISFVKMRQVAARDGFTLVFADLPAAARRLLDRNRFGAEDDRVFRQFPDLDRALEWCENRLLAAAPESAPAVERPLLAALAGPAAADPRAGAVETFFERLEAPAGAEIIRQGGDPDGLYYVAAGRLAVSMTLPDGTATRLRAVNAGTVVGEVGMYLAHTRTASVAAEAPSVLYRLTTAALARMEREDPPAAAALHRFLARLLAERLLHADRAIMALLE